MSAAVPRTGPSRTRLRALAALAVAALAASACAPAGSPPSFPLSSGGLFTAQVVDQVNDVGRAPAITLDARGRPVVSYLLVTPVPRPGVLPQPITAGTPQPPSVMTASQAATGIWTRVAASGQNTVGKAVGLAPEIADGKGYALPGVSTDVAVDAQGKRHVVWSTPAGGVYYTDDASGSFAKPDRITADQAFGVSIAVAATGTAWVSYLRGVTVEVATGSAGSWAIEDVGNVSGQPGATGARTAIALRSNGEPAVAYGDAGETKLAFRSGGQWTVASVPGAGGYGVSLALDKSGNPFLAYYDVRGGVHEARASGSSGQVSELSSWQVTDVGSTSAGPSGAADPGWSTGIAVDRAGRVVVAWADRAANDVVLSSSSSGGGFGSADLPGSTNGIDPDVAVSPDGSKVFGAWFDSSNLNLVVAESGGRTPNLAFPTPTLQQPSVAPAPPSCTPNGTTLTVTAQNIAFDTNCLAAPAGTPFTIKFTNDDAGVPHNVEIFTSQAATTRLGGATGPTDTVTGPGSVTYKVGGLSPGTYFFRCDIHPTQMTGTFVVAAGK